MYLFRATGDHTYLQLGLDALESIERIAKTPCGYASVSSVRLSDPETAFKETKLQTEVYLKSSAFTSCCAVMNSHASSFVWLCISIAVS